MPNNRYESAKKCVESIIGKKEFFCFEVFLMINKEILPILKQKWFSDKLTKDKVIENCSEHTPECSSEQGSYHTELSSSNEIPSRNHNCL